MLDWWDKPFLDNEQLRGVFIGDINHPELDNHIFLLYQFSGHRWYTAFEKQLEECDEFRGSYEVDRAHVMYVYEVPTHQQSNYNKFRASKYSEISERMKQRIIGFHGVEKTRKVAAVMYRHESMYQEWEARINAGLPSRQHIKIPREQEATEVLKMDQEVFNQKLLPTPSGKVLETVGDFLNRGKEVSDGDGDAD